ncbi:MAG TPA: heterodisulfide reductase-related iron-sulfur binding cluster [Thermoanaerobaculia bacterium]|nr:heterodisulfide reductase-related iron-sulfur binding cluster [Thermoanaerobaculia bacterium]
MVFDPTAGDFSDPAAVDFEFRRVADICHTCRRCYNLCPSFDVLFRAFDRPEVDGEADRLAPKDLAGFSDLCYECKLCIPHCPYYPPHRWEVDVPRLVFRDRAARVVNAGKPGLRERILASADALGALSTAVAPLANLLNETRIARFVLEKTLGVHRDRLLPSWAPETFLAWWKRRGGRTEPLAGSSGDGRVALFVTCSLNANAPEVARAAVAVLEKNGCAVAVPGQRCCGMPFLESGDLDSANECRSDNVASLLPFVRAGYAIVSPGPTCSLTLKKEYPVWSADPANAEVAAATLDLSEYLMRRHAQGRLSLDFTRSPGRVLYQLACHLKVQDIGFKSRDLLALIPGANVETVEKCTGHDGTWSMKTEYFPTSMRIGEPVFEEVRRHRPDAVATDCPLAGLQIRQGTGRTPKHPVQILAEAYGLSVDAENGGAF